jgi:phenylacetate-coenzyme A ligase PaaK-like adenylate-forming protein
VQEEIKALSRQIFDIKNEKDFDKLVFQIFSLQFNCNLLYGKFCRLLNKTPENVRQIKDIPFLPVDYFKSHKILTGEKEPEIIFSSSSTTGTGQSFHYLSDLSLYEESFIKGFNIFYGNPRDYVILALLPSYLERDGSSLVYMAKKLIDASNSILSGFFLNDFTQLKESISLAENSGKKILLLGVTYALLDFAEQFPLKINNAVIMETGGMKGRRKEMVREEVHAVLKDAFKVDAIHSEYGMTELLSQAYSKGEGIFQCPPWMRIFTREINDPFSSQRHGQTGGINIIDLSNIYSCSFLSTSDLGKVHPNGNFEVLGRFDNSDLRGCNLLVQ